MKILHPIWLKLRSLAQRRAVKQEIDEELHFHLEQRKAENVAAGMQPEEAAREARKRFGNFQATREQCRQVRGASFGETMLQDIRFGARTLRKQPGFAAIAIMTLALGIGANTGLFTILNALVWQPLPLKDPTSLVNIHQSFAGPSSRQARGGLNRLSYPEYLNYRDRVRSLAGLSAFEEASFTFGEGKPSKVGGVFATGNYFSVLGATPELGRMWSAADCEVPGACPIAVLSHGFWLRRFGGDPGIVGRTISLNHQTFTVIGVAARDFCGADLQVPDLWVPLMMRGQLITDEPDRLAARDYSWLRAVGRLNAGVSLAEANNEFGVVARQSDADPSITGFAARRTKVLVKTAAYFNSPEEIRDGLPIVAVVMMVVGLVLVVVCANVSNLLLARASVRRREIGVRLALGASRARLIRQLLTESLLLSGLAGSVGLALAFSLPRLLLASLLVEVPFALNLTPNLPVLGYCTLVSLVAAILVGLAPALQATRLDLSSVIAAQGALLGRRIGGARLRHVLMITQVAVSVLLLITAGLLVRGLRRAFVTDLGFDRKNLFVLSTDVTASGYNGSQAGAFEAALAARLDGMGGVKAIGSAHLAPFDGSASTTVRLERNSALATADNLVANFNVVSPDYLKALGIGLLRGRNFTKWDAHSGAPVAIISQAMAKRFWPGKDALGQRFFSGEIESREVVGIAQDVSSLVPGVTDGPYFYLPPANDGDAGLQLVVRGGDGHALSAKMLRDLAVAVDSHAAVSVTTVDENVDRKLAPERLASTLAGALGMLALGLVVIGVYGVTAYVVSQRTREIGVRVALGAQRWMIQRQIIGEGIRVVTVGIILGLALAAIGSRVLQRAIFGLSTLDPVTFLGVAVVLLTVSVLACWLPARRAAKVDPMVALRHE
jgi:macrolide transport system ATP-binding/permease protein